MTKMIKNILFALAHPSFWLMNNPFSKEWDAILNKMMDTQKFEPFDMCHVKLGELIIWVANHPYASFVCPMVAVRPSRLTIKKAHQKMVLDLMVEGK